uniref:Uncharacterized protein n=1 Tax=Strongyloides papillosus TaxID=174720 RepID=A0A0N5BU96_STREA
MYSTSFNKVAQIIILICFISFAVIKCEESFQFPNELNRAPIRAKRSRLSVGFAGQYASKLYNETLEGQKEKVTQNYRDTNDPWGYGRK